MQYIVHWKFSPTNELLAKSCLLSLFGSDLRDETSADDEGGRGSFVAALYAAVLSISMCAQPPADLDSQLD